MPATIISGAIIPNTAAMTAIIVTVVAAAIFFTGMSNKLRIAEYVMYSKKFKNNKNNTNELCIAHISDLHNCVFPDMEKTLTAAEPDLIFLTGDIVSDEEELVDGTQGTILPPGHPARNVIEMSVKLAPTFMVFGNHEAHIADRERLKSELRSLGVRLCCDGDVNMVIKGQRLLICGLDDPYFHDSTELPEPRHRSVLQHLIDDKRDKAEPYTLVWREKARQKYGHIADEASITLLLSHRPEEYKFYRELGFDAAFSGHAHGGQWRLPPFINGLYAPHQGLFPRHAGGFYEYDGFVHVVSRGLSTKRAPRVYNRPEVCSVKILPGKVDVTERCEK